MKYPLLILPTLLTGCLSQSPQEQLAAVEAEYQATLSAYQQEYDQAESEAAAQEIFETRYPNRSYFAKKYRVVAQNNIGHEVEAVAMAWLMKNGDHKDREQARAVLFERHVTSEHMLQVALSLRLQTSDPAVETQLQQLMDDSPHASVRACALLSLAEFYREIQDIQIQLQDAEKAANLRKYHSPETFEFWGCVTSDRSDVAALYERVVTEYPDVEIPGVDPSPVDRARSALFAIRQLQPGQKVPEIEGPDMHGQNMRLSQFRGKVVLLSFWGHW